MKDRQRFIDLTLLWASRVKAEDKNHGDATLVREGKLHDIVDKQ